MTAIIYPDGLRNVEFKPDTERLAIKPANRYGLNNTLYIRTASIEGILPHFLKERDENEVKFHVFPDDFTGVEKIYKFPGINKVPSALLDAGKLLRDGKKLFKEITLKKEIKMDETGPQRILCHKIARGFCPTLKHMDSHKMII